MAVDHPYTGDAICHLPTYIGKTDVVRGEERRIAQSGGADPGQVPGGMAMFPLRADIEPVQGRVADEIDADCGFSMAHLVMAKTFRLRR